MTHVRYKLSKKHTCKTQIIFFFSQINTFKLAPARIEPKTLRAAHSQVSSQYHQKTQITYSKTI
jgi:hypothetical protein